MGQWAGDPRPTPAEPGLRLVRRSIAAYAATEVDAEVLAALRRSSLRGLSDELQAALVQDAFVLHLERGGLHHAPGAPPPPALVLSGLMRVFIMAPDGRQVTIRYVREGGLISIGPFFTTGTPTGGTEALTRSRLLVFRGSILRELAHTVPAVAFALLVEMSDRATAWVEEIEGRSFSTLRQRVLRHLLDVATTDPAADTLVARLSQQDLADAAGTLREVVVRILHDLRQEGLIATSRNEVRLLDPVRLHTELFAHASAP
jgi:CRP/FNR family transcriptional regulator, cyclic AMP receptor protein